jgi:hypothetical protein
VKGDSTAIGRPEDTQFPQTRHRPIDVLTNPLGNFAKMEAAGAILLNAFQSPLPRVADPTQPARR